MRLTRDQLLWATLGLATVLVVVGAAGGVWPWIGAGVPALVLVVPTLVRRRRLRRSVPVVPLAPAGAVELVADEAPRAAPPTDMGLLIEEMLNQGRFALLLRPQIAGHLSGDQLERAKTALEQSMSYTPPGEVFLHAPLTDLGDQDEDEEDQPPGRTVKVEPFFLDSYPVTNRQYQQFVSAGGYENMSLWEPEVWPAVLDLVDRSGCPGPRSWRDGRFPKGQEDHPVTGVCWYEAAAFARWVGKRLPTDPEWVKAAAWPVNLPGRAHVQRAHPWGDSMDRSKANLWGSGPGTTVPVTEFPGGVSVGGVFQLIGNVWEWTTADFGAEGDAALHSDRAGGGTLKSLRGGAFDTYFDLQANSQFQSGDQPLARKHNIGFRCALGVCDLAAPPPVEEPAEPAAEPAPTFEEVGA
jgi:iron(II)-dependent oxidoreductase